MPQRCLEQGFVRAVICRKATFTISVSAVMLPQCQFPVCSNTKSGFLCQKGQLFPGLRASRAQNQGFCALLGSGTLVFGLSEHKIGVFVRFCQRDELNEQDELNERDEQHELNELNEQEELNEQDEMNGRVS